mmetsp:Transcript_51853/g.59954  ORF Transcript_51853/g.59954 Transcript_51853/m.59954 type:complete len:90 (-) Transcript_51853:32-301(-)
MVVSSDILIIIDPFLFFFWELSHEKGYAKNMYVNCPRLQHLLDQNPDIRPVFEDARLVCINFETVYCICLTALVFRCFRLSFTIASPLR